MNLHLPKKLQNLLQAPAAAENAQKERLLLKRKIKINSRTFFFSFLFLAAAASAHAADFQLTSSAFKEGGAIPREYTCQGKAVSPALQWRGAPAGTQSFSLIVTDPDAPKGTWTHWVLYSLPAPVSNLPSAIPAISVLANGERNGKNSSGQLGYYAPCPPTGNHHYYFTIYALDFSPALDAGASKEDLEKAMEGHILAQAQLLGRYQKSS